LESAAATEEEVRPTGLPVSLKPRLDFLDELRQELLSSSDSTQKLNAHRSRARAALTPPARRGARRARRTGGGPTRVLTTR